MDKNGRTFENRVNRRTGRNSVFFQKTQNGWSGGIRGACNKYSDHKSRRDSSKHPNCENLPVSHRLERSVFKRGVTRRAYALCKLETSYPLENSANSAESSLRSSCPRENGAIFSTGPFHGDKPLASTRVATEKEKFGSETKRTNYRRTFDDSVGCRFFRRLGDDLIVELLTPQDLHNTEIAFDHEFDWGRAWHGGRVKNRAAAAHIQYELDQGLQAEYLLTKYDENHAFSAFWYLLDSSEIERLANQYKNYKTIKKLCRLLC